MVLLPLCAGGSFMPSILLLPVLPQGRLQGLAIRFTDGGTFPSVLSPMGFAPEQVLRFRYCPNKTGYDFQVTAFEIFPYP